MNIEEVTYMHGNEPITILFIMTGPPMASGMPGYQVWADDGDFIVDDEPTLIIHPVVNREIVQPVTRIKAIAKVGQG